MAPYFKFNFPTLWADAVAHIEQFFLLCIERVEANLCWSAGQS